MHHTTQHFNLHQRFATKRGFYQHVVDPSGGPIGENSMAKNLGFTMEGLGFEESISWSMQTKNPPDTNLAHYPRLMYYYHASTSLSAGPDYLGHVEYITDLDGLPYQHFYYTAWGETLIEEKATRPGMNFDSPYRFNGKELDEETGLYYYGARYYNPTVSVWLGVDPLAHKYPNMTSYVFTGNNPVMLVDPDGREIEAVNVPPSSSPCELTQTNPTPPPIIKVENSTATQTTTLSPGELQTIRETAARVFPKEKEKNTTPQKSSDKMSGGIVWTTNNSGSLFGQSQESRAGNGDNSIINIDGILPTTNGRGTQSFIEKVAKFIDGMTLVVENIPVENPSNNSSQGTTKKSEIKKDTTFQINIRQANGWYRNGDTTMSKDEAKKFFVDKKPGVTPTVQR